MAGKPWSLFVDRDGVVNKRLGEHEHVQTCEQLELLPNVPQALAILRRHFNGIFVVSNQLGMFQLDLIAINACFAEQIARHGAWVDDIVYATGTDKMRKPDIGMALFLKSKHPWIDFKRTVMVGDSLTDMQFGRNIKAKNVWISRKPPVGDEIPLVDLVLPSLYDFAMFHDACMADNQIDWRYEV